MEVKRWHTLAALVCSLSLQAVALAQKVELPTTLDKLIATETDPKKPEGKPPAEAKDKPVENRARVQITNPDGLRLEAREITIQLPNGETRVISVPAASVVFTQGVGGPEDQSAEALIPKYVIGVSLSEVPDSLRAHVTLPEGTGLMIGTIYPDSPAANAGLMQYDLLLKCGDTDLKQPKDLQEIVDASEAKSISLTLQRKGEQKTIEVTPIKREDAKFVLNEKSQLNYLKGSDFNELRGFSFTLPDGQLPPDGFHLTAPVPMRAMISPPAATQQMEALTDAIRQLTEQVERLKGAIDKQEKNPNGNRERGEDLKENHRAKDEGDCWKLPRRDRLSTLISIS